MLQLPTCVRSIHDLMRFEPVVEELALMHTPDAPNITGGCSEHYWGMLRTLRTAPPNITGGCDALVLFDNWASSYPLARLKPFQATIGLFEGILTGRTGSN